MAGETALRILAQALALSAVPPARICIRNFPAPACPEDNYVVVTAPVTARALGAGAVDAFCMKQSWQQGAGACPLHAKHPGLLLRTRCAICPTAAASLTLSLPVLLTSSG